MKRYRVWSLLLALPLLFAACSDGGTGPGDSKGGNSYLRADIGGNFSGKFNASGSIYGSGDAGVAYGFETSGEDAQVLMVMGMEGDATTAEGFEGRMLQLIVLNPQKGSYSIDEYCDEDSDPRTMSCAGIIFYGSDDDDHFYLMTSGTVNITTLTKKRVAGTFEASGIAFDQLGEEGTIQLKNGKFDVEIIDLKDFWGGYGR